MDKNKKFNVELNLDQLNMILGGLAELPYKVSAELVQNLITQYQNVSKASEGAVSDVEAK